MPSGIKRSKGEKPVEQGETERESGRKRDIHHDGFVWLWSVSYFFRVLLSHEEPGASSRQPGRNMEG